MSGFERFFVENKATIIIGSLCLLAGVLIEALRRPGVDSKRLPDFRSLIAGMLIGIAGSCFCLLLPVSTESDNIKQMLIDYTDCFAEAASEKDFDKVSYYYEYGSPIYLQQQEYINGHCTNNDFDIKLEVCDVRGIEIIDKEQATVKTYEKYEVNKNGETRVQKSEMIYLVVKNDNRWLLREILEEDH